MSFHVTITNNETGNVLNDFDTKAIIGGYDMGDEGTCSFCRCSCPGVDAAATVLATMEAAHETKKRMPKPLRRAVNKSLRKKFFKRLFARFSRKREDQEG